MYEPGEWTRKIRCVEPLKVTWLTQENRCNNGWCAHVYDYYFEKDVANTLFVSFGHRHEWEHIIVFVQNDQAKIVAVSEHGEYDTRDADKIRWEGETHPKVVYHKAGLLTHCFRFAHPDDDAIENHKVNKYLLRFDGHSTMNADVSTTCSMYGSAAPWSTGKA